MKLQYSKCILFVSFFTLTPIISADDAEIPRKKKPDTRAAARTKLLAKYDKNENGKFDEIEIKAIARARMLEHDVNKDGRVDDVELKRMRKTSRKMPKMSEFERAKACQKALNAEKARKEEDKLKAANKISK